MQQTHQQIPTTTMQSTGRYLPTSKITLTNYDHLRVKEDSYADLEASDFEADGPYRSYD